MNRSIALFLAFLLFSTLLTGQKPPDPHKERVRKTIEQLFSKMASGDTAALRDLFDPTARLQTVLFNPKTKKTSLHSETLDSFLQQVARFTGIDSLSLEERAVHFRIETDFPLSSAWVSYEFYVNHKLSHTGTDAFELFFNGERWVVIQICDTRKKAIR